MRDSLSVLLLQNQLWPASIRLWMIDGRQSGIVKRGAHPPSWTRAILKPLSKATEAVELSTGFNTHPHQLRFIHHPETVVVQQTEVHGPAVAGHAVAAIEGAAEEHVLGADEDGVFFGVDVPVTGVLAAHE